MMLGYGKLLMVYLSALAFVPLKADVIDGKARPTSPDVTPSPSHAARKTTPTSCFGTVMLAMVRLS